MNQLTFPLLALPLLLGLTAASFSAKATHSASQPRPLPEFNYTDGWLGADDAYSVPLTSTESLWLFGDTFVGNSEANLRSQATTKGRNRTGVSRCLPRKPCTMLDF